MLTPGCFSECFDNMQVCERSSIAYSSIVAVVYSININNVHRWKRIHLYQEGCYLNFEKIKCVDKKLSNKTFPQLKL